MSIIGIHMIMIGHLKKTVLLILAFKSLFCFAQIDSAQYYLIKNNIEAGHERKFGSNPKKEYRYLTDTSSWYFIDYILNKKQFGFDCGPYISNRNKLKKLHLDWNVLGKTKYTDTIKGKEIYVRIEKRKISTERIKIMKGIDTIVLENSCRLEDLKIFAELKNLKIKADSNDIISTFIVTVNNDTISIPDSAYNNLFNPNFCHTVDNVRPIEVFSSANKNYLYIYIFGYWTDGINPTIYLAKFIFDIVKQKYVGKIFAGNSELNQYNCFYRDFIGF